jgi:PHD/YefM family antitoxin component YafN of YafNO toxin-antitoxin module
MIELVQESHEGVMIQRNNEPEAVLISWELYKRIKQDVDLAALSA